MSLSIAFQAASMQNHQKIISPLTRKLPHSKTFIHPINSPQQPTNEIDAIGEIEENLSESEEPESLNTFVFENDRSRTRLSADKDQIITVPVSKDFEIQDKDYEKLDNWNFDITSINSIMDKYRLIGTMFHSLGFLERFEIELPVFGKFLHTLQEKYNVRNNPFHNFDHGFTGRNDSFFKKKILFFLKY